MQIPITENDKCVCCGSDTGVPKSTPLAERKYYIKGSGQLCSNCYFELYIRKAEDETLISPDEIDTLMRMCKKNNKP